MPDRLPAQWATYPGDCRNILNEGAKGPNTMREMLWPVSAEFDGKRTRVGFSYVAPTADERLGQYVLRATPFGPGVFAVAGDAR